MASSVKRSQNKRRGFTSGLHGSTKVHLSMIVRVVHTGVEHDH